MWRALVVFVLISACLVSSIPPTAARTRYAGEVFKSISITRNLVYGRAPNSRGKIETLKLDLREPKGDRAAKRAVFVWVHGGYFKYGDKGGLGERKEIDKVTRAGFVTLSINYRLRPDLGDQLWAPATSEARVDDFIAASLDAQHDAQAAVRWARRYAKRYRLDPDRIAIGGHSAGGLVAAAVAFNPKDAGTSGNRGYPSDVSAAVAMAAAGMPARQFHIDPREPPIQYVHALDDDVVPWAPATSFPCLLTVALLNVCEQVLRPTGGHKIFGGEFVRDFLYRRMIATPVMRPPFGMRFKKD
jgi:acetyl esterase/lipase